MKMERVCELKKMAARTSAKINEVQYFCNAAGAAFIIPSDLSIPSNSDICGKVSSKKAAFNTLNGLNILLILPFSKSFFASALVHETSIYPSM